MSAEQNRVALISSRPARCTTSSALKRLFLVFMESPGLMLILAITCLAAVVFMTFTIADLEVKLKVQELRAMFAELALKRLQLDTCFGVEKEL